MSQIGAYVCKGWYVTDTADYLESTTILAEVIPKIVQFTTTPREELPQPKGTIFFYDWHQKQLDVFIALKNYHSARADKILEKYSK